MATRNAAYLITCVSLIGCTTVEVLYEKPATTYQQAVEQAKNNLSYYSLQVLSLSVRPISTGTENQDLSSNSPPSPKRKVEIEQHHESAYIKANDQADSPNKSNVSNKSQSQNPSNSNESNGGKSTPAATSKDDKTNESDNGQPTDIVTSLTIEGKKFDGKLIALQGDSEFGFMMGGTSGFWSETTVTGTRYPNTDRVQSVSVKAENLTAKRIGQAATIAGSFLSPSPAVFKESGRTKIPDLPAFNINLSQHEAGKEYVLKDLAGNDIPGWKYRLNWKQPAGTITWKDFESAAMEESKEVNYFPVSACIVMELELITKIYGKEIPYKFPKFVASMPDLVRLEPLPIDGKISLSPICGSSVTGTMSENPYDTAFDIIKAGTKAYQDLSKSDNGNNTKASGTN